MWKIRKERRKDRKVRFTLRLNKKLDNNISATAFNYSTSKNELISLALKMVFESDQLSEYLRRQLPKEQKYPFLVITD